MHGWTAKVIKKNWSPQKMSQIIKEHLMQHWKVRSKYIFVFSVFHYLKDEVQHFQNEAKKWQQLCYVNDVSARGDAMTFHISTTFKGTSAGKNTCISPEYVEWTNSSHPNWSMFLLPFPQNIQPLLSTKVCFIHQMVLATCWQNLSAMNIKRTQAPLVIDQVQ